MPAFDVPPLPRCSTALLLIDVVNPMAFEGAADLLRSAVSAADRIAGLRRRAVAAGVPVVFVNDNFDCWHLDFQELVARCRRGVPGAPVVERLIPEPDGDFYVFKPSHSGFFRTGLEVLLARLGVQRLILMGFAGDICVLFTANDAYMRGFQVIVPADCVASEQPEDSQRALRHMARLLKADIRQSPEIDLSAVVAHVRSPSQPKVSP